MAKEKETCETSFDSRLRKDVAKIFDCFMIVSQSSNIEEEPTTDYIFPADFSDKEILQQSLLFSFPFDRKSAKIYRTNHFTFIFTDIEGKHRFGFCKLTERGTKCFCMLSFAPWFEIFYKILNYINELVFKLNEDDLTQALQNLYDQEVPGHDMPITLGQTLMLYPPDPSELPSIPENRNISEYYSALNSNFMIEVFASLMFERRIIFSSKDLSTLTSCVHSAEAFLRPLHWQHIFIPVMPPHLLDYCLAPMPYLVGIHSSLMPKVRQMIANDSDVILADVDTEHIETIHDDVESIPNDVVSFLKSLLRKSDIQLGTNLALAFLRTQARLIGGFKNGLSYHQGESKVLFDEEKFIESHKSSTGRAFARTLIQLQAFKQFVDGRLDVLNSGGGFRDSFETECSVVHSPGDNEQDTVKEWLASAKKGGNELFTQFKRKARGNMKFARESIMDALKQQQQSNSGPTRTLSENAQSIRPSRPSRPPPISSQALDEMRARRQKTPRPPPPPPRPPAPIFRARRSVRKYNSLDFEDDAGGNESPSSASPSALRVGRVERTMSDVFARVDVNLVDDMQAAMQAIVNTNSSNGNHIQEDQKDDLLLDLSTSPVTVDDDTTPDEKSENNTSPSGRPTSLKRSLHVHKRPSQFFKAKEDFQSSSDDKTPSPSRTLAGDPPAAPLLDFTLAANTEKQDPVTREATASTASASSDLLGLDFYCASSSDPDPPSTSTTSALPSKPQAAPRAWVTFDSDDKQAQANPSLPSTNPFSANYRSRAATGNSLTSNSSASTSTQAAVDQSQASYMASCRHLWAGPVAPVSAATAKPGLVKPSMGFPQNQNIPGGSPAKPPVQRYLSSPNMFGTAPLGLSGQSTASAGPNPSAKQWRESLVSMAKQPNASGASFARTRSLHPRQAPKDNELFSDLLNNWKSREGM